ncbi:MAG: hypothetical protein A3G87_09760 [Omnitrophica bacterium RIFCSPLOWO2_12_FULL_50_11]|nr:MAG: hypothetical protein A3G87_09760 [Omnitrophica bacterium RIFCSPLOWO2_12_FULL_50_11]
MSKQRTKSKARRDAGPADAVIRSLCKGLIVMNKQGEPVFMNPAAERLLGVKVQSVKGKSILDNVGENAVVTLLKEVPGSRRREIQTTGRTEAKNVLHASRAVIQGEDGETLGVVSVLPHVTRQKELETMKEGFVGSVTHELRTPLQSVNECVNLLLEKIGGDLTAKQEHLLVVAERNVRRLSEFIGDLLDFSEIERGQFRLKVGTFKLADLLELVEQAFKSWAKSKNISFQVKGNNRSLQMRGDRDRLGHALDHLVGNAMKFTPEGGRVTLEARLGNRKVGALGEWIEFRVTDTGPGIPKEEQEKIFERFEQVEALKQTVVTGAGLGLAIAKAVVKLHRGEIGVESEEGKGSSFYFRIPRNLKEAVPHA